MAYPRLPIAEELVILDGRKLRLCGMQDGTIIRDHRNRIAVRNVETSRLSYITEQRLSEALSEPSDKGSGVLEVGCNEHGEVIINHPDLKPDAEGVGHIVFSPQQVRNLARILLRQADVAEGKEPPR